MTLPQYGEYGHINLTPEEIKRAVKDTSLPINKQWLKVGIDIYNLPRSLDYRNVHSINMVQPVMDQGSCGSCWVLASLTVLSTFIAKHTNQNVIPIQPEPFMTYLMNSSLTCGVSPETPADVVKHCQYCPPCSGGRFLNFMQIFTDPGSQSVKNPLYINKYKKNFLGFGVPGPKVPWRGERFTGSTCAADLTLKRKLQNDFKSKYDLSTLLTTIKPGSDTYNLLPQGLTAGTSQFKLCAYESEILLKYALNQHGAVYLSICADSFKSISTAEHKRNNWIMLEPNAATQIPNHGVVCVGYRKVYDGLDETTREGKTVWICLNSFGSDWGDAGYFYLPCGISQTDLGGWTISQWKQWKGGPLCMFSNAIYGGNPLHFLYVKTLCAKPHYEMPNCTTCEAGYDLTTECTTCVNAELDENLNCNICKSNAGKNPVATPPCSTCRPNFMGINCDKCKYNLSSGVYSYPYCAPLCLDNPYLNPETDCATCIDYLADLKDTTCVCKEHAALDSITGECKCVSPYTLLSNIDDPDRVTLAELRMWCGCEVGYDGATCTACATNYHKDATGQCVTNP